MAGDMFDKPAEQQQTEKKGTVKYEVTVTCWWNEMLYREGDNVELPSNLTPPKDYFKKL